MKQACLAICFLIGVATNLLSTELRDVIAHPEKFENLQTSAGCISKSPITKLNASPLQKGAVGSVSNRYNFVRPKSCFDSYD